MRLTNNFDIVNWTGQPGAELLVLAEINGMAGWKLSPRTGGQMSRRQGRGTRKCKHTLHGSRWR
jgi:hypothetical protein